MITVVRAYGLSVVIYRYDHEPPHVHVIGDGIAKILLGAPDGEPSIEYTKGMNDAEKRRALRAVRESRVELLAHWERIHGRTNRR
jgi:hypothetical protein